MPRNESELKGVTLLGNQNTTYEYSYSPDVLETFENKHPDNDYVVTFDGYEGTSLCITGDTKIDVACNESIHPDGIPIKDLVGTEGYVFGFDTDTLKPVCRKYYDVRKTQENAPVLEIKLEKLTHKKFESCESIKCTPDHLILVKRSFNDVEWVKAKDLKPGDRLIADQRSTDTIRSQSRHRLIGKQLFGEDSPVIHHIDFNHFNNSPENLQCFESYGEHSKHHRTAEYGYQESLDVTYLVSLYESGENFHSLAKMYDCDVSTIESRIGHLVNRRTQAESLKMKMQIINEERDLEICKLYNDGYLIKEISEYMQLHGTRVAEILREHGLEIIESNKARKLRLEKDYLPALNHRVTSVEFYGYEDVYNMEVEDVHNYFANGVVIHNCPKTGQPDFFKIVISYIPNERLVESKSLKLYLFSFRNRGDFHEDIVNIIGKDLVNLLDPKYLEVKGIFSPRGGISIYPAFTYSVEPYRVFERQRKFELIRDASNRTVKYDM